MVRRCSRPPTRPKPIIVSATAPVIRISVCTLAKDGLAELEHFLWSGGAAGGAEGFDAAVNGGGGFAGDRLVGDGFEESFVGRLQGSLVPLERECFCDQL